MSAIVWDDEITMTAVTSEEETANTNEVVWDEEVNLEPVANSALGISEQVTKEFPDDLEGAKAELSIRLAKAGIDEEEIAKRTTAYSRFQTGVAKSLISAYNGLTGAEEGDTSYAMETQLNEEAKQQSEEYKATNIVNKSTPNPDADTESWHGGFLGTEPMFKGTETGQATEMATTLGEIAPVAAAGMAGGIVGAGPVTSAIGAGIGDVAYTGAQAMSEQSDVGLVDVAISAVLGGAGAGLARILNPKSMKEFTTIANMPKKEREAVLHLAKKSKLTEEQMEVHIKDYIKSTDTGTITNRKAVEAGAKGSEREQVGFATEAMKQDDIAKGTVLEETTKRTEIVEDALKQMDEEFETDMFSRAIQKHTLDDEGRMGLDESDPIYARVKENADTFGTKETDIFRDTVKPASPESGKATELLQPFTETTRASIGSQFGATGIGFLDRVLTFVAPNADTKTVNILKKAMKDVTTPKELEQVLIREGIDKHVATQMAKAMEKQLADDALLDEKQLKETAKTEKAEIAKDIDKFFSENTIPADLKKKFTYAKKHGTAEDIEALKVEVLDLAKEKKQTARKSVMTKGIDALDSNKKRVADEAEEAFVDREVRKETIAKGLKAKDRIVKDHAKMVKQEKRKEAIKSGIEVKKARADAKVKADKAEQIETDKLAEANRKQRTKEVTTSHEKESAEWEDNNAITGYGKRYNLAKKDYKNAIGTEGEKEAKKALDDIRTTIVDERKATLEKKQEANYNAEVERLAKEEAEDVTVPKVKLNKNGEPVVPRSTRQSDKDIRDDYKETNRPIGDQDLNPEETGEKVIASKKRAEKQTDEYIGKAHEEEVNKKLDAEEKQRPTYKDNKEAVSNAVKEAGLEKEYGLYDVGGREEWDTFPDFIVAQGKKSKDPKWMDVGNDYLDAHSNKTSKNNIRLKKWLNGEDIIPKKNSTKKVRSLDIENKESPISVLITSGNRVSKRAQQNVLDKVGATKFKELQKSNRGINEAMYTDKSIPIETIEAVYNKVGKVPPIRAYTLRNIKPKDNK